MWMFFFVCSYERELVQQITTYVLYNFNHMGPCCCSKKQHCIDLYSTLRSQQKCTTSIGFLASNRSPCFPGDVGKVLGKTWDPSPPWPFVTRKRHRVLYVSQKGFRVRTVFNIYCETSTVCPLTCHMVQQACSILFYLRDITARPRGG